MSKPAILKTLHYADIFDYPLTAGEIKKFLPEPADATLEETLAQISAGLLLIYTDGLYCLPGREEIIGLRKKREVWSRPKLEKARRISAILKFIPWIKLTAVTGALAMGNSNEDDDIDLMIVTACERLWLTRGLVVMFLLLTGQYRRPGKIKDRICPNLMISEDVLEFPERDLFTAHEIAQMKPIYDREDIYQKFLQANQWIKDFLPNVIEISKLKTQMSNPHVKSQNYFLTALEKLAYDLQLRYMGRKKTTEVTTLSVVRFHPQDIRRRVLDEYKKRVYTLPK